MKRYQSIDELKNDLCNIKLLKFKFGTQDKKQNNHISKHFNVNNITFHGLSRFIGHYKEKSAILDLSPEILALSPNQERAIKVKKTYADGSTAPVRGNDINGNLRTKMLQ
jgi:hypothetical protein